MKNILVTENFENFWNAEILMSSCQNLFYICFIGIFKVEEVWKGRADLIS